MIEILPGLWVVFAPLLIATVLFGGACAVVALFARSTLRRLTRLRADLRSEEAVKVRRTFGVATVLAWSTVALGVALPLTALVSREWLHILVIAAALGGVGFVAMKMRHHLVATAAETAAETAVATPKRADAAKKANSRRGRQR
jgi:hypothetical protein